MCEEGELPCLGHDRDDEVDRSSNNDSIYVVKHWHANDEGSIVHPAWLEKPLELDGMSLASTSIVQQTIADPTLIHAGSMPYRDFRVNIFRKIGGDVDLIYYEPIVTLDPKSIAIRMLYGHRFEVSFTVEMWNAELERRIAKFLNKTEQNVIQIIPYEEVRLVEMDYDGKTGVFQLPNLPRCYLQLNESLDFDVFCDSKESAEMVASPKYLSNHLALVFKSPASGQDNTHYGSASGVKRINRFRLNIARPDETDEEIPKCDCIKSILKNKI